MSQVSVIRIFDASLNRAAEGLRVVEDFVRFALDDPFLTLELKKLRHDLAAAAAVFPSTDRHPSRETQRDVGTAVSTHEEGRRSDAWSVCAASVKRAEQSLRSLEEYGKLVDARFAGRMESLRYRLYTLEKVIDVGRTSRERLEGVRLCVLVDGRPTAYQFERLVRSLVEAGVGMIQLRDKMLDDRELVGRARQLVKLTRGSRAVSIINDRADVAAAVQADGVHVGQEDLSVKDARAVVGARMLVGVSTHDIEQARAAVLDGADYLGAGPTFPSRTKDFDAFAGLDYLRQVSAEIRLPTFAIGGIGLDNVSDVLSAGCARVAVGAAVVGAHDPVGAARGLVRMLEGRPDRVHAAFEAAAPSLTSDI
ncbi:MAG TPA: thiamine phosphate synthase [Lacipirellulaceae bacterium]|nr:thiamine phosphate synthase [Lacipirellulaceae bacterium]